MVLTQKYTQNRTEDPGIRLQNYSHLILKKMLQIHKERTASSTNERTELGIHIQRDGT